MSTHEYSEFTKQSSPSIFSAIIEEMAEAERRVAEAKEKLKEEQNHLKTLRSATVSFARGQENEVDSLRKLLDKGILFLLGVLTAIVLADL